MIKSNDDFLYAKILIQDLPWLIQFQKFNLNDFLDISASEDFAIN